MRCFTCLSTLVFLGLGSQFVSSVSSLANMNGDYVISNPNETAAKYSTDYSSRPRVRYFDVYSPPIQQRYGEVYWTMMDDVPLPSEIVEEFKDKPMAIVGYEVDQVYRGVNGKPDVSIPIFDKYNHHYEMWLMGSKTELKQIEANFAQQNMMHNQKKVYQAVKKGECKSATSGEDCLDDQVPDAFTTIPHSQWFSEGNGGEMRKSYHGYPKGTAQMVMSPEIFKITPMQIDTRNRAYNGSGFKAGPLPKASGAPFGASYSGLLECPCTDRIRRQVKKLYKPLSSSGTCASQPAPSTAITTATECFTAAQSVVQDPSKVTNKTVNSKDFPGQCSFAVRSDGSSQIVFNTHVGDDVAKCNGNGDGGYSATVNVTETNVEVSVNVVGENINITLTGPSDAWFGVGFNAQLMQDEPYAIIVSQGSEVTESEDDAVTMMERKLANHAPGTLLKPSGKIIANTIENGRRTVVIARARQGASDSYYTFDPTKSSSLPIINAVGQSLKFAFHKKAAPAQLTFTSNGDGYQCLCGAGEQQLIGQDTLQAFGKNCLPEPVGDLLQEKNPTCFFETYQGGLSCCHHQNILLDKDQNPWKEQIDTYHMKARFWFEPYTAATDSTPASHVNLPRMYYQTEAWAGEYDVVQCPPGTPSDDCVQEITAHFHPDSLSLGDGGQPWPENATGVKLIYAGGHCHAPSCISLNLYNADTGELLCRQEPIFGTGNEIFNEKGYLAIPPCLWGSNEEGLESPIFLPRYANLTSIKKNNNTYTHYGEMASWQMRGVFVYGEEEH